MDYSKVLVLLERLEAEIDGLEDSLAPVVKSDLSHITSKLPLLDRAKLYALSTYAVDSILFSYLQLNSVQARQHPVFQELERVRHYFEKIKAAEATLPSRGALSLDKEAAARFISAGLSGNSKLDLQQAEQPSKKKTRMQEGKEMQRGQADLTRPGVKSQAQETSNRFSTGLPAEDQVAGLHSRKRKSTS